MSDANAEQHKLAMELLRHALKPEELLGGKREARKQELLRWFERFTRQEANPRWFRAHAFELAYLLATEATPTTAGEPVAWEFALRLASGAVETHIVATPDAVAYYRDLKHMIAERPLYATPPASDALRLRSSVREMAKGFAVLNADGSIVVEQGFAGSLYTVALDEHTAQQECDQGGRTFAPVSIVSKEAITDWIDNKTTPAADQRAEGRDDAVIAALRKCAFTMVADDNGVLYSVEEIIDAYDSVRFRRLPMPESSGLICDAQGVVPADAVRTLSEYEMLHSEAMSALKALVRSHEVLRARADQRARGTVDETMVRLAANAIRGERSVSYAPAKTMSDDVAFRVYGDMARRILTAALHADAARTGEVGDA